ncbi:FecCD family ABC transporter permease [Ruania halotolerans]|uniref:FecCD family ABC transporter permease n=1 Tax=Ruania halotolerans TaxID=2897773 RepID=UPI001E3370FF|nr:iron chelate uptake ABC transporter family permease subunit [Ruania halotolerans]UFU05656.1 iron chelate uptake ABC transporter family permease subunit [Ruania halotolerans]
MTSSTTISRATDASPPRGVARTNRMRLTGLILALCGLAALALLSVAVGSRPIPLSGVLDAVFNYSGEIEEHIIIAQMRAPRTLVGLAVGAALGVAGALIQALTRNSLADPGILGVSSGAAFFVALAVSVFGVGTILGYVWFAFAGALVVTIAVYLIGSAGRGSADPVRLTLAGVALGAVLSGLTTAMTLMDPTAFDQMRHWNAGVIAGRGYDILLPVLPFLCAGALLAILASRALNSIALGEDLAAALGTNILWTRVAVVAAVTLLAGGATAIAGPIGFIGLMVPHIARWIVGPAQPWILGYTLVLAPGLLLISDVIGRVVLRPGEVPVGIITAFVGAPVLILLIRRRRASGL